MSNALKALDRIKKRTDEAVDDDWYALADRGDEYTARAFRDLRLLEKAARAYDDWADRVVSHCEQMNFNTREEAWIAEELEEIRAKLAKGAAR